MAKILFNQPFYSFYVEEYIKAINEIEKEGDDNLDIAYNTPGGSTFQGWTLINSVAGFKGKTSLRATGHVASMGIPLCVMVDHCEALDVTQFMLHRAIMWTDSEDEVKLLKRINADIHKKLKAKIDDKKLKEISGFNLKEIFEAEPRVDVWLTAKEAKDINLINKVVKLERKAEAQAFFSGFESPIAETEVKEKEIESKENKTNHKKDNQMDLEKLKKEHPEVYKAAVALGQTTERDRVGAWAVFYDVDPEAVQKGIKEGADLSATDQAGFSRKVAEATFKKSIKGEDEELDTDAPKEKTPEAEKAEKEEKAFDDEVSNELKK